MMRPSRVALPAALLVTLAASLPAAAQNLLVNPSFESDVTGWSEGGWVDAVFRGDIGSPLVGGSGRGALEVRFFTWNGGSNGVFQEVPVTGGATYSAGLSVCIPSAGNPATKATVTVGWYTASRAFLYGDILEPDTLVRDHWMRISSQVTAPANAAFAWFVAAITNPNDASETRSGIAYIDDAHFAARAIVPTSQALFIPAAASAHGVQGTFWTTTGWLHNDSEEPAHVFGAFLGPGQDNSVAVTYPMFLATIPAHGTVALEDLVARLGRSEQTGGLYLVGRLDGSDRPVPFLHAISQTSTPSTAGQGAYGQGIPAVAGAGAARAIAPGACQSAQKRSNVGVLNTSSHQISVDITVLDANGAAAGAATWTLAAYSQRQMSLTSVGVGSLSDGTVVFARASATGSFCGYLSVVDQHTGDSVYIAAQ